MLRTSHPLLPVDIPQPLEAGYLLPPLLRSCQLQNATGSTIQWEEGIAYIQVVAVNGFWLSYQIFQLSQPKELSFTNQVSTAILHYVLKGDFVGVVQENETQVHYREGQYGLSSHTGKFSFKLQLNPSESHFFQVAFSLYLLTLLLNKPLEAIVSSETYFQNWFSHSYPINKWIQPLIRRVLYHAHRLNSSIIPLNNGTLQLLDRFAGGYKQRENTSRWQEKKWMALNELSAYIEAHLDFDMKPALTTAALARKARTTPSQLKKLFRKQFGISLARFIRKMRMEKARELLSGALLPVGAVYLRVGYANFSAFSRAFAAYHGYLPSQSPNQ